MTDCLLSQQSETDTKSQPAASGFRLTPKERLFFECLMEALGSHGVVPTAGVPAPAFARAVRYDHVKAAMYRRMIGELKEDDPDRAKKIDRVRDALRRAREALMGFKVIWAHSGYVWWTGKAVRGFSPS
jgi:hypothetical protein